MKKLGISISENSVKKIMKEHNLPPADKRQHGKVGSWQKFVSNVDSLIACDFYSKPIYSLFCKVDAYILVLIHLSTRRIWQTPSTLNPNDAWCRQQAINACMWIEDEGFEFHYLIRDNDGKFTNRFDSIFKDLTDADKPVVKTGIRMPKMNAYCESFIGHLKAECLNHFSCLSLSQLDHIAYEYQRYHNNFRPHQGKEIGNRILDENWEQPPPVGAVKRQKILGGLLNHYYRDVA